jgi:sigma-B regulation protein RsbU (phosphoserine phosphatase)
MPELKGKDAAPGTGLGPRKPIRRQIQKIVMLITLAALLFTSAVGFFSMLRIRNESEKSLKNQLEQNLTNLADSKAAVADAELSKYAGYIRSSAEIAKRLYSRTARVQPKPVWPPNSWNQGVFSLQRFLARPDIKLEDVEEELGRLGNLEPLWRQVMEIENGVITDIYIATESGLQISYNKTSAMFAEPGQKEVYFNYYASNWYVLARDTGDLCFTGVYPDSYDRGLTITCAAPVDRNGEFVGVVSMDILIEDLQKKVLDSSLGTEGGVFLVDGTGRIIGGIQDTEKIHSIHEEELGMQDVADQILSGKPGLVLGKNGVYFAHSPVRLPGWTVCVAMRQDVVTDPLNEMNRSILSAIMMFALAFLGVSAAVTLLVWVYSRSITYPLSELKKDVETISGGDLSYRAKVRVNDEVGDLAQAFNSMSESLAQYIENLTAVTAEKERIGAELSVAAKIQADMLPREFPPFPDRKEFDLYAMMDPAKEVGGDFYDFFLTDEDHLAMVMADVSGKGVPAALFMVISKTMLKNRAQEGGSPAEILMDVNRLLCVGNDEELFVTVWLGILTISTGELRTANAGHEYPAVTGEDGRFFLQKSRHSPPLAVMEGIRYREETLFLKPGDRLFVYTDGVTEAFSSKDETFGEERLVAALNQNHPSPEELVTSLHQEIELFAADVPQFDDITMLCLNYLGPAETNTEA